MDFISQGFLRVFWSFRKNQVLLFTEKVGASRSQGFFAGVRAKIHGRVLTVAILLRPSKKVAGAGGLSMVLRCTANLLFFLIAFMILRPSHKVPGAGDLCMVLRCASDIQWILQDGINIFPPSCLFSPREKCLTQGFFDVSAMFTWVHVLSVLIPVFVIWNFVFVWVQLSI